MKRKVRITKVPKMQTGGFPQAVSDSNSGSDANLRKQNEYKTVQQSTPQGIPVYNNTSVGRNPLQDMNPQQRFLYDAQRSYRMGDAGYNEDGSPKPLKALQNNQNWNDFADFADKLGNAGAIADGAWVLGKGMGAMGKAGAEAYMRANAATAAKTASYLPEGTQVARAGIGMSDATDIGYHTIGDKEFPNYYKQIYNMREKGRPFSEIAQHPALEPFNISPSNATSKYKNYKAAVEKAGNNIPTDLYRGKTLPSEWELGVKGRPQQYTDPLKSGYRYDNRQMPLPQDDLPKKQIGGPGITPQGRDQWNRQQTAAFQQGYQGNNHNRAAGAQFMQSQGTDPGKLAAYQQDLLNQSQVTPWGNQPAARAGSAGFSGADNFYGNKTAGERYTHYAVQQGNQPARDFGTDYQAATAYNNGLNKPSPTEYQGFGDPKSDVNYNPSGYSGFGHTSAAGTQSTTPAPSGLAATGFPTLAEAKANARTKQASDTGTPADSSDYSIDSVRSEKAQYGGIQGKRKVRITPPMAYGGPISDKKSDLFSFDSRWNPDAYQGQIGVNPDPNPYSRTSDTLPEAHPDDANVNAEKQEQVLGNFTPDGLPSLMGVNGKPHTEGGKNVVVPDNSFIFSDTKALKIKDPEVLKAFNQTKPSTPAQLAKQYKLQKFTKQLADPDVDPVTKKTAQLMVGNMTEKLNQLASVQESMKNRMGIGDQQQPQQQMQPMAQYGGLPKAQYGLRNKPGNGNYQEDPSHTDLVYDPDRTDGTYMKGHGNFANPYSPYTTDHNSYHAPVSGDAPVGEQQMQLQPRTGNNVIGIPRDEAQKILNGKDRVPYTKEIASRIGYDGRYGDDTYGLQRWEQEQAPGYDVSRASLQGKPDGILGVRTLSPPQYVNPWDDAHDTPERPAAQLPTTVADPTTVSATGQGNAPVDKGLGSTTNTNQYGQPADGKVPFTAPTPDKWGIANSILNAATIHRYPGWEAPIGAVAPNTVFEDPTRQLAALHEQSNAASQNAAISGNSRAARANAMGYQNADAVANTIGQVANRNVQTSNQASDRAAQISNALQEKQAARLSKMYQENVISAQQYDNALREGRNDITKQFQTAWNDRSKTDFMNKTSPYFNFNPVTGARTFKDDAAKARLESDIQKAGQGSGISTSDSKLIAEGAKQYMTDAAAAGVTITPEQAWKHAAQMHTERTRVSSDINNPMKGKRSESFSEEKEQFGGRVQKHKFGGMTAYGLKKFVANSYSK